MSKKTILVITDGIGNKPDAKCNAFLGAKKPTYDYLFKNIPYSSIHTHGYSVGLPEGQMGNSEVGHMTIGAGRVLDQDLVKITKAIKSGSIKDNPVLKELLPKSDRIHLVGLMSDGGVHSHIDHALGLAKLLSGSGKKVFLHFISDGRDVSPHSAPEFLEEIEKSIDENIQVASISGRFYTMDRDNRWERVKKGYDAIVNATPKSDSSPIEYVKAMYDKEITDEFMEPTAFSGYEGMEAGDSVIMINFRSDRAREIVKALGENDFKEFETKTHNLNIITMTSYDETFPYPVMFPKENVTHTLAETISKAGLRQFHTAETEKYAHVTFFLNGGREELHTNEDREVVPSPKVSTYDLKPEMSAQEVGDTVLKAMDSEYDFIVVNFANGDMVGHTGVYEAALKAVEAVDRELGRILEKCRDKDYNLVLTSDHGNCEEMCKSDGTVLTNHTVGDVWCFVMSEGVDRVKDGGLNNIAPTVLKLMGVDRPKEMDEALF
ncbi:MAG: 2,3-bisphosphoglycerate-independent phosphoglycerate mutase [Campylobacterales bacterium]